jgi:hypothetical protein
MGIVRGDPKGELMQVRLAKDNSACIDQSLDGWRGCLRHEIFERRRTACPRQAGDHDVVLDHDRHAMERPKRLPCCHGSVGRVSSRASTLSIERDERVQLTPRFGLGNIPSLERA